VNRALILGVSGQDGQFLADHLIRLGYTVLGVSRNKQTDDRHGLNLSRPQHFNLDITDVVGLRDLIGNFEPDEIYNLSGESSVAKSYLEPTNTVRVNTLGLLNILESIRDLNQERNVRIFQASSSEMFGSSDHKLNEKSALLPISPYGMSKSLSHRICAEYRETFDMWVTTGILFNHESELHDERFVFQKVIKSLVEIKLGIRQYLELGNINIQRDWGYAKDYVIAMHKSLQSYRPNDFIIATGKLNSLRDLITLTISYLKIDRDIDSLIKINPNLIRPTDIARTWGDPSRTELELGWKAQTGFAELVQKIVHFRLLDSASKH
jgi:GDPmannose 4,6-dehydratase